MTSLEYYAEINPGAGEIDRASQEPVAFVPMAAVSEEGRLESHETRPLSEVAKGYTSFARGDVLMAKITPCMENGKAALVSNLATDMGFGSTEFHVLRARPGVDSRFLFYLVWNQRFRAEAAKHMTGSAGQKRVPASYLKQAPVPLIEPKEQRRIADILDKADVIRRKRKEAIALTEELLRSTFLEMFGDPVTNPKGWSVKPLRDLLSMPLRNGLSPASGGKFEAQVLTLSAITRGQFDTSASKLGTFAVEPWEDVRVDARDFLICRGNGNVSLVGTAAFPLKSMKSMVFPDTMIAARVDQTLVRPAFLNAIWKLPFIRSQIEANARTTNGTFKINQTVVEGIEIVLPPPAKQQVFADVEARVAKNASNQHKAIEHAEDLFNSLVARAFSGGLSS